MANFKQAQTADALKQELIELFNSVRLAPNASKEDVEELKAIRKLLKEKNIPGNTPEQKRAQACYTVVDFLDQVDSSRTKENVDLVNEFANNIGLASNPSYRIK